MWGWCSRVRRVWRMDVTVSVDEESVGDAVTVVSLDVAATLARVATAAVAAVAAVAVVAVAVAVVAVAVAVVSLLLVSYTNNSTATIFLQISSSSLSSPPPSLPPFLPPALTPLLPPLTPPLRVTARYACRAGSQQLPPRSTSRNR